MHSQGDAGSTDVEQAGDATPNAAAQDLGQQVRRARGEIATRFRHIRQHHPEGPFTLERLASVTGVSKRNLALAESPEGANLKIETLVKIAHSLGIERWAYFLDAQVFDQVNIELSVLQELRQRQVETVALRKSNDHQTSRDALTQLSELIAGITNLGQSANEILQDMPGSDGESPGPHQPER
ncbi:helix-turn-helix domain-containing protein [Streptomyces sp. H27-C3]|uniref:helix-turn-helix domain-containing protein n=1 Tax=Streptomyces sp. H27-C3 TaxID=3046305 RepID=UPI0024BA8F3A|nr:helix-turn-helix domain-containing protein [Streptomyces sp. H27-C3]MDJ0466811.1 helix-turn-helix domain-containing protein [Streptomyces sp. H27-C3]